MAIPKAVRFTGTGAIDVGLFLLLGLIWGGSYAAIKVAVMEGVGPVALVAIRLVIGALVLGVVVALSTPAIPRDPMVYRDVAVLAVLNMALPFSLIGWAEERVDSSVAAVIGASIPIAVVGLSWLIRDEAIGPGTAIGVAIGMLGVLLLAQPDSTRLSSRAISAYAALIGATLCYGAGAIYARRTVHHLGPMVPAFMQVLIAACLASVLAIATRQALPSQIDFRGLVGIAWLGGLSSGLAYLIYFRLLARWGAARTSTFAYLLPVVGIANGVILLGEPMRASLVGGGILVGAGTALVARSRRSATSALTQHGTQWRGERGPGAAGMDHQPNASAGVVRISIDDPDLHGNQSDLPS